MTIWIQWFALTCIVCFVAGIVVIGRAINRHEYLEKTRNRANVTRKRFGLKSHNKKERRKWNQ